MRKSRTSLVVLILVVTAALNPGAAVFASVADQAACQKVDLANLQLSLAPAKVIVIATVGPIVDRATVTLQPEAYLKGAASGASIVLRLPETRPSCPIADFPPGSRVLAILESSDGALSWPTPDGVFRLFANTATTMIPNPVSLPEADLVRSIRDVTGQYAVPAKTADEGASIDWIGTVVPMTAALLVVFAISLVLMRAWHRIDPS